MFDHLACVSACITILHSLCLALTPSIKLPSLADWEYIDNSSLDVAANSADKGNETGEPISPSNVSADERSKSSIRRAASVRFSLRRKRVQSIQKKKKKKILPRVKLVQNLIISSNWMD